MIYVYKCPVCGQETEVKRKCENRDDPIGCHKCLDYSTGEAGAVPMRRIKYPGKTGVQFKCSPEGIHSLEYTRNERALKNGSSKQED